MVFSVYIKYLLLKVVKGTIEGNWIRSNSGRIHLRADFETDVNILIY